MSKKATTKPEDIWANVFRVGQHVSSNGQELSVNSDDLSNIASGYNAANDPAPVVIGHPKTNDPAYGWVDRLRVRGDRLQAKFKDLQPAFVEAVKSGAYKQISISLRRPEVQRQRLRHVGFLGGAAPAIAGLGTVDWVEEESAQEFSSEFLTGEDNQMDAEQEKVSEDEFAEREAAVLRREKAVAALEAESKADFAAKHAALEARVFDAEFNSFAAELQASGIVNPLGSALSKAILASAGEANFSEGETEVSLAQAFKDKLLALPKTVDFSEVSADPQSGEVTDFSESDLIAAARAHQTTNPKASWPEAVSFAEQQFNKAE